MIVDYSKKDCCSVSEIVAYPVRAESILSSIVTLSPLAPLLTWGAKSGEDLGVWFLKNGIDNLRDAGHCKLLA